MNFSSAQLYVLASLSDEISELVHDGFSMLKTVECKDKSIYRFVKDDRALLILEKNDSDRRLTLEKSEFLDAEFVKILIFLQICRILNLLCSMKYTLIQNVYNTLTI